MCDLSSHPHKFVGGTLASPAQSGHGTLTPSHTATNSPELTQRLHPNLMCDIALQVDIGVYIFGLFLLVDTMCCIHTPCMCSGTHDTLAIETLCIVQSMVEQCYSLHDTF